jgi:hypothetical protein
MNLRGGRHSGAAADNARDVVAAAPIPSIPGRIIRFLAIVWAIASAFWLLEKGTEYLFIAAMQSLADQVWQPSAATDCTLVVRDVAPVPRSEAISRSARFVTWSLGFETGFGRRTTEELGRASGRSRVPPVAEMAGALGVPVPKLPDAQHLGRRLIEFGKHIDTDAQCIAAILSYRYSPQHGGTYQFASLFGYVYTIVHSTPEMLHDEFLPELRYYGRAAGIPQSLWVPIVSDPAGMTPEQIRKRADSIRAAVDDYMRTSPLPEPSRIDALGSPPAGAAPVP